MIAVVPNEPINEIAILREQNKHLWQMIAELVEYPDFEEQTRRHDTIIELLKLAQGNPEAKRLLGVISMNDRKISDLTAKL